MFLFQLLPVAVLTPLNPHLKFSEPVSPPPCPCPWRPSFSFKRTLMSLVTRGLMLGISNSVQSLLEPHYPHRSWCTLLYNPWVHQSPLNVNYRAHASLLLQSSPAELHWSPLTISSQFYYSSYGLPLDERLRGRRWIRLWYSRSSVLFPLVRQSTNCLTMCRVAPRMTWFWSYQISWLRHSDAASVVSWWLSVWPQSWATRWIREDHKQPGRWHGKVF